MLGLQGVAPVTGIGGSMLLGLGFEALSAQARPNVSLFLLPANPDVELLVRLQHHVCLPAVMIPAMIITN